MAAPFYRYDPNQAEAPQNPLANQDFLKAFHEAFQQGYMDEHHKKNPHEMEDAINLQQQKLKLEVDAAKHALESHKVDSATKKMALEHTIREHLRSMNLPEAGPQAGPNINPALPDDQQTPDAPIPPGVGVDVQVQRPEVPLGDGSTYPAETIVQHTEAKKKLLADTAQQEANKEAAAQHGAVVKAEMDAGKGAKQSVHVSPGSIPGMDEGDYDPAVIAARTARDVARIGATSRENVAGSKAGGGMDSDTFDNFTRSTKDGREYLDATLFKGKDLSAALKHAAAKGIPALNSQAVGALQKMEDARSNIQEMLDQFEPIGAKKGTDVGKRFSNYLQAHTQIGPDADKLAAWNTWRTAAIGQLQALAGGQGSGLRINQAEIKAATESDIPTVTDSITTAKQKLKNVLAMIDKNQETMFAGFGKKGSGADDSGDTKPTPTPKGGKPKLKILSIERE